MGAALIILLFLWAGSARAAGHRKASGSTTHATRAGHGAAATASAKQQAANPSSSGFLTRRPRYQVQPGDVLVLQFPITPDMNQTVTIEPDGYITLKGAGDFYAQGKTTDELAAGIEKAYGKILNQPQVTVVLTNFQQPAFVVGGEVARPGKYDLRAPTTVIEALAIAGGTTPASKTSQVLLFRRMNASTFEVKKLNVKQLLHSKDLAENVMLRPGDMLYVPQNTISKIARFLPTSSAGMYFSPTALP